MVDLKFFLQRVKEFLEVDLKMPKELSTEENLKNMGLLLSPTVSHLSSEI